MPCMPLAEQWARHPCSLMFSGLSNFNPADLSSTSFSTSKPSVSTFSFETTDIPALMEMIRSNWSTFNETDRSTHLNRLKTDCEKYHQTIQTQYSPSSTARDKQVHQLLQPCLMSMLDLLYSLTLADIDLSIKSKLVLSTCLAWLVKYGQVSFCRKHVRKICSTFKNILLNGQANNRQLAVGDFRREKKTNTFGFLV